MYHICANCRARAKDRAYSYPKGWHSRPTVKGIILLCPDCLGRLRNGVIA
jgi:hypothetical protein